MTDSQFYDYGGGEGQSYNPPVAQYTEEDEQRAYDNAVKGFYTDQYDQSTSMAPTGANFTMLMPTQNAASAMYQAHHQAAAAAYAASVQVVKREAGSSRGSGMPPTPPGSPDDPKEISGMAPGMVPMHMNPHHLLTKPLPMRRLSDSQLVQSRTSMGAPDTMQSMGLGTTTPAIAHALSVAQSAPKRPRTEKKPVPDDTKDNKYFERRKRNNNAAKKSRDARKAREDEIAIRASFLEKENAILRAQVATLREEANSLRQLLLRKTSRHHHDDMMGMKC